MAALGRDSHDLCMGVTIIGQIFLSCNISAKNEDRQPTGMVLRNYNKYVETIFG